MTGKCVIPTAAAVLLLALGPALALPQQGTRRPEYRELIAAQKIADPAARLKEFERIKAAYPQSTMMTTLDSLIRNLKISLCSSLDAVLDIQKAGLGKGPGISRVASWFNAAMEIINHPNRTSFDKDSLLKTILAYQDEVGKLSGSKPFTDSLSPGERPLLADFAKNLRLAAARAYLNAGDTVNAASALGAYRAAGGEESAMYKFAAAETASKSGKDADALAGYLAAAAENYENAAEKARAAWIKTRGSAEGFENALKTEKMTRPFALQEFPPVEKWQGKTVLAELFTGSECPTCLGFDFGFAGLIDSVPIRHLAVLEYHLPLPRPDPMINPASRARREYYGVTTTPAAFFDGRAVPAGGGSGRAAAGEKYKLFLAEVSARTKQTPATLLEAKAVRNGETITVDVALENPAAVAAADIIVALTEREILYEGGNGVLLHRMVVRDLKTIKAEAPQAAFDLAAVEKTTDEYLTAFESFFDRVQDFKFAERRTAMSREALRVVVFIQDRNTKKVYNAFSLDVK